MRRKEIQRRIDLERKYNFAELKGNYIMMFIYNFLLFLDKIKNNKIQIKTETTYKGEWEQQNILLDQQKLEINKLNDKVHSLKTRITRAEADVQKIKTAKNKEERNMYIDLLIDDLRVD